MSGDGYDPRRESEAFAQRLTEPDVGPLPELITVSQAFMQRLPSQRVMDLLARFVPDMSFGDMATTMMSQMVAFRWLLREHPTRDANSLWMAAYDIEVALAEEPDVPLGNGLMPLPASVPTGI